MSAERVLDASVAAALFFPEAATEAARAWLDRRGPVIAPDLIFPEFVHVAVKKLRRRETDAETAAEAVATLPRLVGRTVPSRTLAARAFALAVDLQIAGYDAIYVALAEAEGAALLTLDAKLVDKLRAGGRADVVELLAP